MLARVANSLYWIGRYIERSEHLARYLKVEYFSLMDTPMIQNKEFILRSILMMYGVGVDAEDPVEEQDVLFKVGKDTENPSSLISNVYAARENARSVRYTISTELWEVINQYYHFVKDYPEDYYKTRGLYDYTVQAGKHCALVRSYLDHTLVHDDTWIFIELGIYLERSAQIIHILRSKLNDIAILTQHDANMPLRRYQLTITLKVLEGLDMHRRVFQQTQTKASVCEFLLSYPLFPRSTAYSLERVRSLLKKLSFSLDPDEPLMFKTGKLASHFRYLEVEEVMDDMNRFLNQALEQIFSLHDLIDQKYFQST